MTDELVPPGWVIRPGKAFNNHVGPFYQRQDGDSRHCGFVTDERHANKRDVTHGGMIAMAFDTAMGNASWDAAGQARCATVQLNITYIGALKLHEFAEVEVEVTRATRSLVFVRAVMRAGGGTIATADGVWKILIWREDVSKP